MSYGYHKDEAEIVRRVLTMYADGCSARNIAARLNAERVQSPGARWNRSQRRKDGKWLASTIAGDPKRGTGILNNELYIGRMIWNRSKWTKDPDTGRRRQTQRPREEWIMREVPEKRIVSDELWQGVKDRQAKQAHQLGTRVIGGLRKHKPGAGRPSRYMLSGLLRCDACRSGFVISGNSDRYRCASHTNGGNAACEIKLSVPRKRAEGIILDFTERELPGILTAVEERYRQPHATVDHGPRIAELEKQVANFVRIIGAGEYSPAISAALKAAETELAQLKAATAARVRSTYRTSPDSIERRVKRMREQLGEGGEIGQGVLRELFPIGFWLYPDPNGGRYLWAFTQTALAADWATHLDADGYLPPEHWPRVYGAATDTAASVATGHQVENSMVAGACNLNYSFPLAA